MAGGGDISAGRAFVTLFLKNDFTAQFARALANAQKELSAAGQNIAGAGAKLVGASVAALTPAVAAIKDFVQTGGDLADMAARTGIAASSLAELGYALQQTGGELADLETASKKLSKTLADAFGGDEKSTALLKALGLSIKDLKAMTPEQQLIAVGEAIDRIKDPAVRSAAAMELLGKGGTKLLPILKDLEATRAEARSLGVMTDDDVAKADDLGDAFGRLMTGVRGVGTAIASALYPPLKAATAAATEYVQAAIQWVRENQQIIVTAAKIAVAVGAVGAALVGVGSSLMAGASAIKGFLSAFAMVKGIVSAVMAVLAVIASPIGLVATALVAAGAVFLTLTDTGSGLIGMFRDLAASITGLADGADIGAIIQGIGQAASSAVQGVMDFIQANRETIVSIAGVVASVAGIAVAVMLAVKGFAVLTAGWGMLVGAIAIAKAAIIGIGAVIAFLVTPMGMVVAGIAVAVAAIFTFTDAGAMLMQSLSDMATAVVDFGKQVGGGIVDALKAGEFKLAGEIAMQALYVVFQEGLAKIKTLWLDLKFGILSIWDDVVAKIQEAWSRLTGGIAKVVLQLMVKAGVAPKDALKNLEESQKRETDALKEGKEKRLAERDAEYKKQVEDANKGAREARKRLDELTDKAAEKAAEKKAEQAKVEAKKAEKEGRHIADIEGDEVSRRYGEGGDDDGDDESNEMPKAASVFMTGAAFTAGFKGAGGLNSSQDKNAGLIEAIKEADKEQAKRDKELKDAIKEAAPKLGP